MTKTLHGLPRKTLSAMLPKKHVFQSAQAVTGHHNQIDGVLLCITDDLEVRFPSEHLESATLHFFSYFDDQDGQTL